MIEYDVAVAYNTDGIQSELKQRGEEDWRLVYGYQAAPGCSASPMVDTSWFSCAKSRTQASSWRQTRAISRRVSGTPGLSRAA